MNSPDPWRVIVTDPYGGIILPRPVWRHPFYREVPSWTTAVDGESRVLFDGTFVGSWAEGDNAVTNIIGAELTALSLPGYGPYGPWIARPYSYGYGPFIGAQAELPQRTGLTAELAPVLAPATGGVTVETRFDDRQVMHVKICVDGKCYQSSMNLAPAIAMVMQKLASWHDGMHAPKPPPATVVSTVETAVGMAEDAIVGALIARHIDVATAGWLDDIKGGLTKVVNTTLKLDVFGIHRVASGLVKKLKTPITMAATAAATAYGGPLAGAAAAKLVGPIIDQTAEFGKKKNPAVAEAEKRAKTDPVAAKALKAAQDAVAQSIAAYHVKETAQKAGAGDPVAKQKILDVAESAEKGDPAAKAVADLAARAMTSEAGAKLWERATGRGPGTVGSWSW
jgi:hypothetical protein